MLLFKLLSRLRTNQRGNALAIGAAVMPLLLGASAMAVDSIQLALWKRQLQRAADSSAIAGVHALSQGANHETAVSRDLARSTFPALSQPQTVTPGPHGGYNQAVRVDLVAERRLPFMSIFLSALPRVQATATAAVVRDGEFCVVSLYEGTLPGVDTNGNATVNLGCGVASNSRGTTAVTADGNSLLSATPIMAVGGLNASSNFAPNTVLQPYSTPQTDPFGHLPNPAPSPSQCSNALDAGPQDVLNLSSQPNNLCYRAADIKGTVNFGSNKTITIYGGDFDIGSQANISCDGCTFVLTGPNGDAGDLNINAQARLNLTAPDGGTYDNILFYRDRRASNVEIKINGGAAAQLDGALYFPSSDVTITGSAGFQARCFQLVGRILTFRGSGSIVNTCPDRSGLPSFALDYVRLIG